MPYQVAAFYQFAALPDFRRLREPLRALLARLIASTFFWLPALRDLFERYTLVRELDADRLAQARTSPRALAGALHAVAAGPRFAGSVGFADRATSHDWASFYSPELREAVRTKDDLLFALFPESDVPAESSA